MLHVLCIGLLYALLTFGGVLRNSWFILALLWMVTIGGYLIYSVVAKQTIDLRFLAFLVLTLAIGWIHPKMGVTLAAAGLAWEASRGHPRLVLRFLHILLVVGVFEAALGLFQYFVSPGWIFGYYGPSRSSGTYINRNHFAAFLSMIMPIAFAFAFIGIRRFGDVARSYLYILIAAFLGLAVVFSVSRAGILSFLVTVLFLGLVLRLRETQRRLTVFLTLGLLILTFSGAVWIGIDVVAQRYGELVTEDAFLREGRVFIYRDTLNLIKEHPWGVGTGMYVDAFRAYQTFRPDLLFDHAHNDYLETLAEWGLLPGLIFWILILFVQVRTVRAFLDERYVENQTVLLASMGAISSILIHSLADFSLQIPSNAMLFLIFLGLSISVFFSERSGQDERPYSAGERARKIRKNTRHKTVKTGSTP